MGSCNQKYCTQHKKQTPKLTHHLLLVKPAHEPGTHEGHLSQMVLEKQQKMHLFIKSVPVTEIVRKASTSIPEIWVVLDLLLHVYFFQGKCSRAQSFTIFNKHQVSLPSNKGMRFRVRCYKNKSNWVFSGFHASKSRAIHICSSGPWSIPDCIAPIIPNPEGIFVRFEEKLLFGSLDLFFFLF